MRAQTRQLIMALAAYLLLCCLLLGRPAMAEQQGVLACSELSLRIKASRATVGPGKSIVLAAKVANKGAGTLSGVGVRLDLPTGLVAQGQPSGTPIVVDVAGSASAYWTALTLKPGKHRVLRLKARTCGAATAGSFPLEGAAYVVNATDAVVCLSPMTAAKPSKVRRGEEGTLGAFRYSIDQSDTRVSPPSHTGVPCLARRCASRRPRLEGLPTRAPSAACRLRRRLTILATHSTAKTSDWSTECSLATRTGAAVGT